MFNLNRKFLALLIMFLSAGLYAQRFRNGISELGFMAGMSNYFGDLAPEIQWNESHPAFGILYKYHHSAYFSSRYQFTYAKISGNDMNVPANSYRNIRFESNIFELGYFTEFNFKPFGINFQREENSSTFVFAGINLFYFEPVRLLPGGDKVELRDIGTEGQNLENKRTYSQIQPALTLGLGYKFNIKRGTVIGLEMGFRKTFTDYLDDTKNNYPDYNALTAKQGLGAGEMSHPHTLNENPPAAAGTMRGDPGLNDWYFVFGFTITFRNVIHDPCP